ncbi:hypothetical protein BRD14_01000 [Halobacteriales archaeon SW_5_68_122]|nr:MAG: hypothetical protein BRD14_01000 [Halobacteriales archaeon SW_5_68_122]
MTVPVASTEADAGKRAVALALAKAAASRERDVGYTKPVGISPGAADDASALLVAVAAGQWRREPVESTA